MRDIINSFLSWLLAGVGSVAVVLAGVVWWQFSRIAKLNESLIETRTELATCGGRIVDIQEDARSDNEIDTLPDSALRDVPDHWLQPDTTGRP